jgi:lysophospholipase L1-like esterase
MGRVLRATTAWLIACALAATVAAAAGAAVPSPIAFDWSMPDTYGSVLDANGLPKSTAPRRVPVVPGKVILTVKNCDPDGRYAWSVNGTPLATERVGECGFASLGFRHFGSYKVQVNSTEGRRVLEGREEVTLADWLIVSLGDSVASGEGVPERAGFGRARWQDDQCHRSAYAGPAVAAWMLAKQNPRVTVTFVHLACSGATIRKGLIGRYKGVAGPIFRPKLPPQVSILNALARRQKPIAVLISIGANDVEFSKVVIACARKPHRRSCFDGAIGRRVRRGLDLLPLLFQELDERLEVTPTPVFLTEYFDPTGDATGEPCQSVLKPTLPIPGLGLFGLNQRDVEDAHDDLLIPLNDTLKEAEQKHGWNEIAGIAAAFRDHGYCAGEESWITTLEESFFQQGDWFVGTLHPNKAGQQQIAELIEPALRDAGLAASCLPPHTSAVRPVDYAPTFANDPVGSTANCIVPAAFPLVNVPGESTSLSVAFWVLLAIGGAALVLLALAALDRPRIIRREAARLATLLAGVAMISLGAAVIRHSAPSAVLIAFGALALLLAARTSLARGVVSRGPRPAGSAKGGSSGGMLAALVEPTRWNTTNLVVLGLGAALIVFFAGATAAVAAGATTPTALWAAGSAVSGALIGLLVPGPRVKKSHQAAAQLAERKADEASKTVDEHSFAAAGAEGAVAAAHTAKAEAAKAIEERERSAASEHNDAAAAAPETTAAAIALGLVFLLSLALAVVLATGTFSPPHELIESLKGVITAIVALAAASGSALIGLLAPSSSKG